MVVGRCRSDLFTLSNARGNGSGSGVRFVGGKLEMGKFRHFWLRRAALITLKRACVGTLGARHIDSGLDRHSMVTIQHHDVQ